MLLNYGVGEDSWESLGLQGDQTSQSWRKSVLHWKDWCWSWNSNTLATWCKEVTHLKRPWCWERLKAGGEGGDRGWDGQKASPAWWTWVWASSGSWWWTGKSMGSQRVRHDWVTELSIHRYFLSHYPNFIFNLFLNFMYHLLFEIPLCIVLVIYCLPLNCKCSERK